MSESEVAHQLIEAVRRGDADGYCALFAIDAVQEHPLAPVPLQGRGAIRDGEQALFEAFSDIEVDIRSLVRDGARVAVEVVLRATNTGSIDLGDGQAIAASGRRIELPAVWLFDVGADGLIVAERDYFDTGALMSQLGIAP